MATPKYPLARLSPAKDELLVVATTHESVIACDIEPLLGKLSQLIESRDASMEWEGRVTFYFEGWDDDPRETAEIPEIRAYFQALTDAWPYWLHFIEKVGDTFGHVLRLLCRGHVARFESGMVGWQFNDLAGFNGEVIGALGPNRQKHAVGFELLWLSVLRDDGCRRHPARRAVCRGGIQPSCSRLHPGALATSLHKPSSAPCRCLGYLLSWRPRAPPAPAPAAAPPTPPDAAPAAPPKAPPTTAPD